MLDVLACIACQIFAFTLLVRFLESRDSVSYSGFNMNEVKMIELTKAENISWEIRDGAEKNEGGISWAMRAAGNSLASGFGRLKNGRTPEKTLEYDEVIYVLQGVLGVSCNGSDVMAQAGEVLSISRGATVAYFGTQAEFFFVVTAA